MSQIKLIVGLNNPGAQYDGTRHNAGEWVLSALCERNHVRLVPESKYFGATAKATIEGQEVRLLLPSTFMNLSGKSVSALANFFRIAPQEILVIHDELDLPPGIAKFKLGGGHGGHNGLKDIIARLGNQRDFYRLRLGIGHPGDKSLVSNYVLSKPAPAEREKIIQAVDEATRCIELMLKQDINAAMNRLNGFKAN
ncbi:aminoacyl-tRNA hydrolase [Pasteurellaceae bacterium HPA106]|uniref:aminoacyl-tRNA hydrolase n=1 Tax=Spirabiliibacterium pneumoniae TaxID=221400 RepID=UPI001AAE0B16|nr:aminoacyl-tRNA hydrolase [Spirabiliibacterium pneumoniae]MBE2895332.1 aminoacyl-tRNA hydrolase [Spirabiliibacterium pneumoniae]